MTRQSMPNYTTGHSWSDCSGVLGLILRPLSARRRRTVRSHRPEHIVFGESGNNEMKTRFAVYIPVLVRGYLY